MRVRAVTGVLLGVLGCSLAWGASAREVTATTLNVRTGPGTSNAVIGQVHRGEVYAGLRQSGSWWEIQFDGRKGWAHGSYLKASSRPLRSVTTNGLNVRTGASTRYRALGQLSRGNLVAEQGSSGSWRRISFGGRQAWVHGSYLTAAGSTTPAARPHEVVVGTLNVRSGPGTQHGKIGSLTRGQRVNVTGSSGSWKRIDYSGRAGWVYGPYLAEVGSSGRPRSRRGFVQLAASGPGFYNYSPSSDRWGTPRMIYGLERIGRRWRGQGPRMGIGDVSLANGGRMPGHVSHQLGVDVDVRPVRGDGREGPITIYQSAYSRTLTQRLLNLYVAELRIRLILFNDTRTRPVQTWPNHHNHFHARIY